MKGRNLTLLALALLAAGVAAAQDEGSPRSLVESAVETYTRALDTEERGARLATFRRAEHLFERVIAAGASNAEVYTSLGNAALLGGDLGEAVLAYRRALVLEPTHARALQNLGHARSLLPAWVPQPEPAGLWDSFFFWHRALPRSTRVLAAAVCFTLASLLVAASLRTGLTPLRNAAWLPGLVWLALLGSTLLDTDARQRDAAVLTAEETVARAADSVLAPGALPEPLPGGTEVQVLEPRPPWLRVRLANGRDAWVQGSSLRFVVEPTPSG